MFLSGATTHDCIQVNNEFMSRAVRPGDDVKFEGGELEAVVLEVEIDSIKIQFKGSGMLKQSQAIYIPGHRLSSLPILTG